MIKSRQNASVYLRAPEYEVIAKDELWQEFRKDRTIFIRSNFPHYKLESPVNWSVAPYSNPAWHLYFHSLYFLGTVHHGWKPSESSEAERNEFLGGVKALVFSYFDFLALPATKSSIHAWDDHASAYRASYLSLAYSNLLHEHLDEYERARYRQVMREHAEMLGACLDSDKWRLSNHTLFHIEGLLDIALNIFGESSEGKGYIQKCRQAFLRFVSDSISVGDGTSKEHALFYHAFMMERLRSHLEFLELNGIAVELDGIALLRKMNRFLWLVMPQEGWVLPIGDTKYQMQINPKFYRAFKTAPYVDGETRYLMRNGSERGDLTFLSEFREDGYFVMRDLERLDAGLLSIFLEKKTIGPHGHVDGASFVSYLGGTPLFIDCGGPFIYRAPLRHRYFQTQLAHSTAIFGRPTSYRNEVVQSRSGENWAAVLSRARMDEGGWWLRVFGQISSSLIFCMDVALSADQRVPVQIRYHVAPEARIVVSSERELSLRVLGKSAELQFHEFPLAATDREKNVKGAVEFDEGVFPKRDRERALLTRTDGEYEEGNMICRNLVAPGACVLVCSLESIAGIAVRAAENQITIDIPAIRDEFAGGRFSFSWSVDHGAPACGLDFMPREA